MPRFILSARPPRMNMAESPPPQSVYSNFGAPSSVHYKVTIALLFSQSLLGPIIFHIVMQIFPMTLQRTLYRCGN